MGRSTNSWSRIGFAGSKQGGGSRSKWKSSDHFGPDGTDAERKTPLTDRLARTTVGRPTNYPSFEMRAIKILREALLATAQSEKGTSAGKRA
jgi:hypothetical protein